MMRSRQVSPVPEIGTPGLRWRGLETAYGEPKRARSWNRRIQPRGAYGALRQSSTLPGALWIIPAHLGALSTDEGAIAWLGVARTYESRWTGLKILGRIPDHSSTLQSTPAHSSTYAFTGFSLHIEC